MRAFYEYTTVELTFFSVKNMFICHRVDQASVHGWQSSISCFVCCGRRAQSWLSACSCSTDGM